MLFHLEVNKLPYIHFTEEQKLRASSVDLVEFLRRQGEKLVRSGPEYRMTSDHSITVRGNEWYDHAVKEGGGPISFVQNFYGLSYPEAVTRLLNGAQGQVCEPYQKQREESKKEFIQPPAGKEMRRLYAYLLKKRFIGREVLNAFVRVGLIYEDANYHNAVFIGKDEHGVVRHAHKRSTSDIGKTFRINVEGSDPRYSFHWNGASDRLYVFEAPIDLLSSQCKDWNEDIKAQNGLDAQPAEEHPQLIVAPEVCGQIGAISETVKLDCLESKLPSLLQHYRYNLHWGRFDKAMDCAEQASALALAAYGRELRQMGRQLSAEGLAGTLQSSIQPHQNRGSLKNRHSEIAMQIQSVLARGNAAGIRSQEDKQQLADAWLELAVSFAKIPIKYEAEELKQQQKQEQSLQQEMG